MLSHFSLVQFCATLWTAARLAPLSMGFYRQEDESGLPCPPPGDLPDTGVNSESLISPALAGGFFTRSPQIHFLILNSMPFPLCSLDSHLALRLSPDHASNFPSSCLGLALSLSFLSISHHCRFLSSPCTYHFYPISLETYKSSLYYQDHPIPLILPSFSTEVLSTSHLPAGLSFWRMGIFSHAPIPLSTSQGNLN